MKISVITVCYNASKTIERTFNSVLSQADKNFEYIVIEGKSKDNTVEIIKAWEKTFLSAGIEFKWISEPDGGLYDAMNKGAQFATGEWIIYMNADDEFADPQSIGIAKKYLSPEIGVLYGDSVFITEKYRETRKAQDIDTIFKHLPFIPQSAFIRTEVQRKYSFDLKYKIAADYDSFLRMYLAGVVFKRVEYCFSHFYVGGISNSNEWNTYKEDIRIKHKYRILNKYSPLQMLKYIRRWIMNNRK